MPPWLSKPDPEAAPSSGPAGVSIPVERADLEISQLPAALEGFTILHLSDTHVTRRQAVSRMLHEQLLHQLSRPDTRLPEIDLAVLTGDYMSRGGDEPMAGVALRDLVHVSAKLARLGCCGVFGNHDHAELKDDVRGLTRREGWPIRWMHRSPLEIAGLPLEVVGSDWPESFEQVPGLKPARLGEGAPLRLALGHTPDCAPEAHRAGAHLVLAGHTHGGQVRMPTPGGGVLAAFTSTALIPRRAPSGIYRFVDEGTAPELATTLAVTRGVGFQQIPIRVHCPPQIALYTLRRAGVVEAGEGRMPREPVGPEGRLEVVRVW
ncbi:MAG: metallophosphoesterase [Phycisphaerales bacterium]